MVLTRSRGSRAARLEQLTVYRWLNRNVRNLNGSSEIHRPKVARTPKEKQSLRNSIKALRYKKKPHHTLVQHVAIVNRLIQDVINWGDIICEGHKVEVLYKSLPREMKRDIEILWEYDFPENYVHGRQATYEWLVYALTESHLWRHYNNSTRSDQCNCGMHYRTTSVDNYFPIRLYEEVNFEQSIPKLRFWI